MTYRFVDRLSGNACEVQAGGTLLGRFILEPSGDEAMFLNSVAISESAYCVPDLRGQWQLLQPGQERIEGTISRTQVLDRLDTSSILDVGTSVEGVISSGGTWLDALGVSPLVPGMSERAELQDFEKFLAEHIGHLIEVCKRPRTHLRVEVERTAVSRARRVATQASSYLAAHTEDWDRPTLRAVIPKRILSLVRESPPPGIDSAGLSEEERVGTEGGEEPRPPESVLPPTGLSDLEVARAVSRRARALTKRMVDQLRLASADRTRRAAAVLQLFAVIALVRELRHLDKTSRWQATGQLLVEDRDRRYLLDESLKHLLGSTSRMLEEIDIGDADTEEGTQLRVLLLWLAWDLGEELTDQLGRIWDAGELQAKLRANAMFLKLIPPIAQDAAARSELEQSISRTIRPSPEAALRASKWLVGHLKFGAAWARGVSDGTPLRVGGYCRVPGMVEEPRVVLEVSDSLVGFWDYDRIRSFARDRVVAVMPAADVS